MISAIILTHNNKNIIERTLASLQWCDERIVVDDCSTDITVDIVKKYNVTLYTRSLDHNFAAQRNFGLDKASHEWVLFVDSDEVVSDRLKQEIQEKISSPSRVVGYYIQRVDTLWNHTFLHGETGSIHLLRLGKKGKGKWERNVHEVWNIQGQVAHLMTPLLHFPHPSVSDFLRSINSYTSLNANSFLANNIRMKPWQIVVYPLAKFIQNYLIRLGFLDGTSGFVHAMMMSFHSFLTRGKMWELQRKQK